MAQDAASIAASEEQKKANAEAIAKVASQTLDSQQNVAADTIDALDTLAKGIVQKKEAAAADKDEEGNSAAEAAAKSKEESDKKAAEEAAKSGQADADKAAADKLAAEEAAKSGQQQQPPVETPEQKAAREQRDADKAAADAFFKDSPVLPAKASPKSAEAFESVKIKAAQEISKLSAELDKHRKEVEQLRAVTKEALTPEVKAEIESLREFRAKLDIETDPRFKKFDADIKQGDAFIYAQLRKSPLFTKEVEAEIEKLGGPSKVKMGAILDGINDPLITRLVEGKLADLEVKQYEKSEAIKAAQSNVKEYLTQRQKEWESSANSHNEATKTVLNSIKTQLPWLTPVNIAATATKEEKAAAEAHNAFATKTSAELDIALNDDSPDMRATLLIGMANLFKTQNTNKILAAERDALKTKLDVAEASLAKLKSASVGRLRDGGGLPSGNTTPAKPKESDQFTMSASDALDNIRKQKAAAQQ